MGSIKHFSRPRGRRPESQARCFALLAATTLCLVLRSPAAVPSPDSDYDGRTDAEEKADGTDPRDSDSVRSVRLAVWKFNRSPNGERGQEPVQPRTVTYTNGLADEAVLVSPGGGALRYRAVEPDGRANVNLRNGTIRFYFRGLWGRTGPGDWVRLVDAGFWHLSLSPDASRLCFVSQQTAGGFKTNAQVAITLTTSWQDVAVCYSPTNSIVFVGARYLPNELRSHPWGGPWAAGVGTVPPATRNGEIAFGSALDGKFGAPVAFDEIETFNYPTGFLGLQSATRSSQVLLAESSDSPPAIALRWVAQTYSGQLPRQLKVNRRELGTTNWTVIASLPLTDHYTDTSVVPGVRYEYFVGFDLSNVQANDPLTAPVASGIRAAPVEQRGRLLLLVDETLAGKLEPELATLRTNLIGDGWQVVRFNVPRHDDEAWAKGPINRTWMAAVAGIKAKITNEYGRAPLETKGVIIVGHVAVPYSGVLADDGHSARNDVQFHEGAWPADVYYGDVDGDWEDKRDFTAAGPVAWRNQRLSNVAGDGKWDTLSLPPGRSGERKLELFVGRIDFANLPAFANAARGSGGASAIEVALLKRYLQKDARFRRKDIAFGPRAQVWTHGWPTDVSMLVTHRECLALSSRLFGTEADSIEVGSPLFARRPVLLGFQGGYGTQTSVTWWQDAPKFTAADFARSDPTVVMWHFEGSDFPDWNLAENNLMKASLATPNYGLLAIFSHGSSHWRMHKVGMGEPVGAGLIDSLTEVFDSVRATFILGDPTLRLQPVAPPSQVSASRNGGRTSLKWGAAAAEVLGYWIYHAPSMDVPFTNRLTSELISGTNWTDNERARGPGIYEVRAVTLERSGCGSFTNLSQGVFVSVK